MAQQLTVEEKDHAFHNRLQSFSIVNHNYRDIREFFAAAFPLFEQKVSSVIEAHYLVKISSCFVAEFEKNNVGEEGTRTETEVLYLHTPNEIVDFETDLGYFYDEKVVVALNQRIDDVALRGSGFALKEILELNIQISSFDPCSGSTYIPLHKFLQDKHAIINVKNKDNLCFKYAVLSALRDVKIHPERVSHYKKHEDKCNFKCLTYPVDLKQISKFEKMNPAISINVYMFDDQSEKVRPLRLTEQPKANHIHLLLLTEKEFNAEKDASPKSHYCWIKNLSALLCRQITSRTQKLLFCDRCLNHFYDSEKLQQHLVNCLNQNQCQVQMPSFENNVVEFKNIKNQLQVPFIVYADIESILKPTDYKISASDSTSAYQHHVAYSIGYYFKCMHDDTKSYYKCNRSPTCIEWFAREMHQISVHVDKVVNQPKPLNMSMEDEVLFGWAEECHICGVDFVESDVKVRDHSHITGEFRGAAHQKCNLNYQEAHHIPVVFHNLSNYDAHFIIKELANNIPGTISIIPCNDQRYVSFTLTVPSQCTDDYKRNIKLRFIDSFRFMASSLDQLSSLLPSSEKKILKSQFHGYDEERIQMLERKGVFCYDHVDSWQKLNETSLPSKESFHSQLNECDISDDDYKFAQNVWSKFNIKTLGEYSDLYMKTDILLLADVFENFRATCFNIYKLDPAHYYTAPGLSFDAMMKYTQIRLELLTNIDMLLFVERGIRGGISQCSKRHCLANNKYMNDYDATKNTQFLMYLDANNLYGYSMMQSLPECNYRWCTREFSVSDIENIPDDVKTGYFFEVDLEYPEKLHNKHKDYPFCAENRLVPHTNNEHKLLLTLYHKKNYVVHYKMLQCALRNGLVLKKIHKVLEFTQSQWLKPYIILNTELRTRAKNEFEKNFFKLLINAIYGKTMENVRSRVDIRVKKEWKGRYGASKLISMPNFKRFNIFDENLVAIEMNRTHVEMDKPIPIGMAVLDLSKVLMYDFYYGHIKEKYGEQVSMVYTDTDSMILEVETGDFYDDMKKYLDKYDTSDFPVNNVYSMPRVNKKVPGLFKDELNGEIMTEFVGLRSKMYCVRSGGVEKMKKAKGVKKYVLKKKITFQHYLDCIQQENCTVTQNQNTIRSINHNVYSVKQSKVALSPADNKRCVLEGNIETLPWGHYAVPSYCAPQRTYTKKIV